MIFDLLENYALYNKSGNNLFRAFEYLLENEYIGLPNGKHQIIGDEVFAIINEYDTKSAKGGFYEAHRDYVDLQYMVEGSEMIGYAPLRDQKAVREYDKVNDYSLYEVEGSLLSLSTGMFAIFYPGDLHMPGIGEPAIAVKKIVIKIRI